LRHWITSFVLVEHESNVVLFCADDKGTFATIAAELRSPRRSDKRKPRHGSRRAGLIVNRDQAIANRIRTGSSRRR
jgi:hypothetical protein